jgi:hypothetical protein
MAMRAITQTSAQVGAPLRRHHAAATASSPAATIATVVRTPA